MLRSALTPGLLLLAPPVAAQGAGVLALLGPDPAGPAPLPVVQSPDAFLWSDGFRLVSADEEHQLRIGGRLDLDANWRGGTRPAPVDHEVDVVGARRARLLLEGRSYGAIGYRAVLDLAGPNEPLVADAERGTEFADLYLTLDNFLVGTLRAGQFFEPFGLEANTYSEAIAFQERSEATRLVAPGRGIGVMLDDQVDQSRLHWAVGLFATTALADGTEAAPGPDGDALLVSNGGGAGGVGAERIEGNYALTGRVTWAPRYEDDGREVVHLGASLSRRGTASSDLDGVGGQDFDDDLRLGLEAAAVFGPWSVQAEYLEAALDGLGGVGDLEARGAYAQVAWLLTGETRPYRDGAFGPVEPHSTWRGFGGDGRGAFELALRLSTRSLEQDAVDEQVATIETALNWYLNANARVMLGFETSDGDAGADWSAVNLRWQLSF